MRVRAKKRLGQHFLIDEHVIEKELAEADLKKNDIILEVGPGYGALTLPMAGLVKKVIAVEQDPEMVSLLEDELAGNNIKNVEIIRGDALKVDFPAFDKCVSNIPYKISSGLVEKLGRLGKPAVLIVQREFAERMTAGPEERNYSRISVLTQYHYTPIFIAKVKKGSFRPRPNVESAIVKLVPKKVKAKVKDEKLFFLMVRGLFSHRNKKVWKALSFSTREFDLPKAKLAEIGRKLTYSSKRVRELSVEQLSTTSEELKNLI